MVDLKIFASELANAYGIAPAVFNPILVNFLEDNNWFGIEPVWNEDALYISSDDISCIRPRIELFMKHHRLEVDEKVPILKEMFSKKFPDTYSKFLRFTKELNLQEEIQYSLLDFMLVMLPKDACLMSDPEVEQLIDLLYREMSLHTGNVLTFFLSWLKKNYKTAFLNDYILQSRTEYSQRNQAYDSDEYLELVYYLFNEEYILENEMYIQAANSKNHADTWLFLCMHFICSLRVTDLERLYHPRLTMAPEEVLEQVKTNCFSEKDARLTLYSITWRLSSLPLRPSKTSSHSGISSIKFCVPESAETHIGTLLAICEAHRLIAGIDDDVPLIRRITTYEQITRYMGEEIGSIFLESNFRTRSANKSYLQSLFMFSDEILDSKDSDMNMKGYMLASLARSHKGSYGEFAKTTSIYLRDANFSGLSPEFVARELFERGVLSFIPSMLLKIITKNEFAMLPVHKQTELIQILDLSPMEIENVVKVSQKSRKRSRAIIEKLLVAEDRPGTILKILHRIASGIAVSKQDECLCLMSAIGKNCVHPSHGQCIGCEFEISTKSTVFLLISEYNRLKSLLYQTDDPQQKLKYESLIKEQVLPSLDEIFECVAEQYGHEALHLLEEIIQENIT